METSAKSLPEYLKQEFLADRKLIETELDRITAQLDDCPARLGQAVRYAVLGPGKRLRPLLVLAATRACGGSIEQTLPVACAVELIHSYSLVHDDLPAMDDDDLRRGRPTCHIEFDEATAILVGDALIPLAFESISRSSLPADRIVACVRDLAIAAGAHKLVGGQADDLAAESTNVDRSVKHLESIHMRKTAALIAVSLKLGGIASAAPESHCHALEEYGVRLGLAFQITDDLLDFAGDPETMGKRSAKDDQRGKLTYPTLLGPEASRQLVQENIDRAIRELKPFGESARGLIAIACSVADRTS